jgi:hypothetical protein
MARPQYPLAQSAGWQAAAIGLTTSAAGTAAVAAAHMLETAQRGMICGATSGGLGHCWACYAAPLLALAAITAWRQANLRMSPARARDA